ncbi:hypothetical protein PLESTM_001590700 [Pleodorina starrii]|nr:hypothetical protein PLESTM_000694000 [Pleodorina starrii]GLC44378.1 hypothetical protein PLESTM_001590700 [Pleodorina starrii]
MKVQRVTGSCDTVRARATCESPVYHCTLTATTCHCGGGRKEPEPPSPGANSAVFDGRNTRSVANSINCCHHACAVQYGTTSVTHARSSRTFCTRAIMKSGSKGGQP